MTSCTPTQTGDGELFQLASASAEEATPHQGIIAQHPSACMDDTTRERVRGIMLEAVDDALHDHIKHLFSTWMKDERGQPSRAGIGARQGIKAHQLARKAITEWNPPEC